MAPRPIAPKVNDWQDIPPATQSAPKPQAASSDWQDVNDWQDAPDNAIDYNKPAQPSNLQKLGTGIADLGKGALSGAASTVFHGGDLLRRATGQPRIIDKPEVQQAMTAPDSTMGKVGKFGEQAAEFMIPGGMISKGAKAVEGVTAGMRAAPLVNTGARAALEGISAAGVTGAQTGGDTSQMKTAGLTAGATSAALPAVGALARKAGPAILGKTTGAGEESIRVAANSADRPAFTKAMRGGTDEPEIVGNFKQAVGNAQASRSADYRAQLAKISQQQGPPLDITPVRQELLKRLQNFRVKVTPNGLDFSRSVVPPGEENTVKQIAEDVIGWDDYTPLGVDALKRRIGNQYSHNSDVRALMQAVKDSTRGVLNTSVPGYADMTKGWETASKFINEVVPEFSLGPNAKTGAAIRKISYALKQNNEYRQMLTEALDQFTNSDLKGQLAGYHLKDTLPKGLMGVGSGIGILGAIATGNLTPGAAVAMLSSSPRLVGETLSAMAKLRGAGSAIGAAIPRVAAAATVNRQPIRLGIQGRGADEGPPVPQFARGGIVAAGPPRPKNQIVRKSRSGIAYGPPQALRQLREQGPPPPPR